MSPKTLEVFVPELSNPLWLLSSWSDWLGVESSRQILVEEEEEEGECVLGKLESLSVEDVWENLGSDSEVSAVLSN